MLGAKPRGSAIGDIDPEYVLDSRDIRATGATSIDELLQILAPETGSVRGRGGGRPILLIDGQRISSFRELRDIPPEAIERMDILPEEVALKYGYPAEQRVVNIVLRPRFNSTTVELEGRGATDGGRAGVEGDLDRLIMQGGSRTSLSFDVQHDSTLGEDERGITFTPIDTYPDATDPRDYRTLLPRQERYRFSATHRKPLGDEALTVNLGLEQNDSHSLFGAPVASLVIPGDSPFSTTPGEESSVERLFALDPLGRVTRSRSADIAAILTGGPGKWNWSMTANAGIADSRTRRDRGADVSGLQERLDALDPTFDPYGPVSAPEYLPVDLTKTLTRSAGIDAVVNGTLGEWSAGPISATLKLEAGLLDLQGEALRDGVSQPDSDLYRGRSAGSVNLDVPLLPRDSKVGKLSINANTAVESLSDFGELVTYGAGLNWQPTRRLDLLASWTREEGAPTLNQLGDPQLTQPNSRIFDFTTGETVLVTAISGGNPDLLADDRKVMKLSANWQAPTKIDLNLRAEFVRERIDDPIANFPAVTEAIEAAFPDRFMRDQNGVLTSVDLTPVNYDEARRDNFRWGFRLSKQLQTKPPSEAQIEQFRERFRQQRAAQGQGAPGTPPPQAEGGPSPQAEGGRPAQAGPGGGGGRFRFGGPGGGRGGRLSLSLFHTIRINDDVRIAPDLPRIDYLDGEAAGSSGGRSRHEVELEGGYYNNGLGLRLSGNWRSATHVNSADGDIRFDDYAKFNLRAFVNLTERFDVMADKPWLRGTSLRINVDNIFNARPQARDALGNTPINYQPDLLEPQGRVISIMIRKLFVPTRFFQRGGQGRQPTG